MEKIKVALLHFHELLINSNMIHLKNVWFLLTMCGPGNYESEIEGWAFNTPTLEYAPIITWA